MFFIFADFAIAQSVTLQEAVLFFVEKNPTLQVATFTPKISATDVLKSDATFDTTVGTSFLHNNSKAPLTTTFQTDAFSISASKYSAFGSTFSLSYTKSDNIYTPALSASSTTPAYNTSVAATFTQNLLKNFGSSINTTQTYVVSKALQSSQEVFINDTLNAVYDAQIAYWNLYEAQETYKIAEYGLVLVEELLRQKERMVELGGLPKVMLQEIYATKADLLTTSANDEKNLILAKKAFSAQLGMLETAFEANEEPNSVIIDTAGFAEQALNSRHEIKSKKLDIEAQERLVKYYQNQLLPTLTLNSSINFNNPDMASGTFKPEFQNHNSFSVGVNLSVPIENSSAKADSQKSFLTLMLRKAELAKIEQDVKYQATISVLELERAKKIVKSATDSVGAQEEVMKNQEKKFELGMATIKDYIDNQQSLIARKKALISYRCAQMRAVASYYKAIGKIPDFLKISLGMNN